MYCIYGNSSWYINGSPLFGADSLLGGSVIIGSTALIFCRFNFAHFVNMDSFAKFIQLKSTVYSIAWPFMMAPIG